MKRDKPNDIASIFGGSFEASQYLGNKAYVSLDPPRLGAAQAMQSHGMKPPALFPVGQLFRFPDAQDKAGEKTGWAIYYEFISDNEQIGICIFGSWRGDPEKVIWSNKRPDYMSAAERSSYNEKLEHARKTQEQAIAAKNESAAIEAQRIWANAGPVSPEHEYIKRKGIKPYGARQYQGRIILPVRYKEKIVSLQYICDEQNLFPGGRNKGFLPGGKTKGGYMRIDGEGAVYECEGWATGCSLHEATGATVYIAYMASNLLEVGSYAQEKHGYVIIAADNDRFKEGNAGLKAATVAAEAIGCGIIAPAFEQDWGKDYNDLHQQIGTQALRELLTAKPQVYQEREQQPSDAAKPYHGAIANIVAYYNATSGNWQPGFAVQTALAICSIVCGRYFVTDEENYTALYFLNVGKSATGKEHCKRVVDRVLYAAGLDSLVAGDGFTSNGAVLSLLMAKPRCITVIDEFGRYLEAANSPGSSNQKEANTALMEAIGRPDGILRPKNYSTFGITKEQAEELRSRYVYCPSLTLLALTTPNTFFDQIKMKSVLDGFMNRFIVYVSDAQRAPRRARQITEVPQSIIDWIKKIQARYKKANPLDLAQEMPKPIVIQFSAEASVLQKRFELEVIGEQDALEEKNLDALPGRINEFAMRMALICALSRDPEAACINEADMAWAVDYMRRSMKIMTSQVTENVSDSFFEAHKKEVLEAIRKRGASGIPWSDMQSRSPYSKHKPKELKEMLASLVDAELLMVENAPSGKRGRPSVIYTAIN